MEQVVTILDSFQNAIVVTDLNLNIVECNRALLDLFGYSSKDEIVGKNAFDFMVEKDHERAMKNVKKTLEQGSRMRLEYMLLTRDGHEKPVEVSVGVTKDDLGNTRGFVAVMQDITERKLMKRALRDIAYARTRGREFLRSIYTTSGLQIKPRTYASKIDALKEIIRAWGMDPEEVLAKKVLAEPCYVYADPSDREEERARALSIALKDMIRKELTSANADS